MIDLTQAAFFLDPVIEIGLTKVDQEIVGLFRIDHPETLKLILPLIQRPGKRLRPSLALLSAAATGCVDARCYKYATVIELIHTASLFHDDVLDNASLRRGFPSANQLVGNQLAILIGDYLYSKAISLMISDKRSCQRLVNATVIAMTEGEIVQLNSQNNESSHIDRYYWIIERKTARLMELACSLGASICGTKEQRRALSQYGRHLGLAFQIIDDLLDWVGGEGDLGKNIFQDIRAGRITLPALLLMESLDIKSLESFRCISQPHSVEWSDTVLSGYQQKMIELGIDTRVRNEARRQSQFAIDALSVLPQSHARDLLIQLPEILVKRVR